MRIVLFIGQGGRAPQMLAQLIDGLPPYGDDEPARAREPAALLDGLAQRAHASGAAAEAMRASRHDGRQPSTFLLASELLLAHVEQLANRVPTMLTLATIHFGPDSAYPIGGAFVAKLLARLTTLPKEVRRPLESPPSDDAGRARLVAALCATAPDADEVGGGGGGGGALPANGTSLREGWAAVCISSVSYTHLTLPTICSV